MELTLKNNDSRLQELLEEVDRARTYGSIDGLLQHVKQQEQELANLRKSMVDMRTALTAEVAEKHDIILSLRRNVQKLEEQCRHADKHTHFKDDIIKEMRKELKKLKQQIISQANKREHVRTIELLQNCSCPVTLKETDTINKILPDTDKPAATIQETNKIVGFNNGKRSPVASHCFWGSPTACRMSGSHGDCGENVPIVPLLPKPRSCNIVELGVAQQASLQRRQRYSNGENLVRPRKKKSKLTLDRVLHEYYTVKMCKDICCSLKICSELKKERTNPLTHTVIESFINNKPTRTKVNSTI